MKDLVAETNVQLIATDALKHGLRNVLTGQPHQMLRGIELSGTAEHKTSFTEVGERKPFSNSGTQSELLLQAIVGMMNQSLLKAQNVALRG